VRSQANRPLSQNLRSGVKMTAGFLGLTAGHSAAPLFQRRGLTAGIGAANPWPEQLRQRTPPRLVENPLLPFSSGSNYGFAVPAKAASMSGSAQESSLSFANAFESPPQIQMNLALPR